MKKIIILALLLLGGAGDFIAQPSTYPVLYNKNLIAYPFGEERPELSVRPGKVYDILLQPGETVEQVYLSNSSKWLMNYSPGAVHILSVGPGGIGGSLFIQTDQRHYKLKLISDTKNKSERPTPKQIAFYLPDDEGMMQSQFVNNTVEYSDFSFTHGDHSFPWEPENLFEDETSVYIQLEEELTPQDLPDIYAVEDETRTPIDVVFFPQAQLIKIEKPFQKGVLVYEFEYPGFLGFTTVRNKKELFISTNQKTEAS